MEKDKHIEKLIKEIGLESPSGDFTDKVMKKIHSIPEPVTYKPLIGKTGRISILVVILSIITLSIMYSEPSGESVMRNVNLPKWEINLPEFPDFTFSTGLLAVLFSILVLLVIDAALRRRRLV